MEVSSQCPHCTNDHCIRSVPLFASLEPDAVHALTAQMEHKHYQKGEILVREGDTATGFTVIRQGSAKAYRTNADGREQILYIFPANDYYGARFLFTEEKVPYTVEALEETDVCILSKAQFALLLEKHSSVALQIIGAMANRMSRLETAMQSMGGRNADLRIASLLLEFKEPYGRYNGSHLEITLPLSREGLANYLGLARETLSRKLVQFEEDGLIELIGQKVVRILDLERLAGLSVLVD
ncbi:MAG: Crp/Fnr family transcriptional regulator [Sphaerochaeta sp.]|jgi:CRP/FNR family transcriptional regulator|uniref:Crp/Fnr family transcriptional regulator n=1 Tax=unclassified Sphaerochaeta TaxID=2637943 RepID=UPI000AD486D3|nr:Crp/Fnr family transcriptional regulator [Sphaerochaeta sp. UBA5856]MCK9600812.1 Crp/Fnr family transcriptional regulator [Sphaerochaeta sp.]